MSKIIFKDLPDTSTPINAENLNKITEDALEYKGLAKNTSIDFNEITQTGIYYLDGTTMSNGSSNYTWSYLVVIAYNTVVSQIIIKSGIGIVSMREYSGTPLTWKSWINKLQKENIITVQTGAEQTIQATSTYQDIIFTRQVLVGDKLTLVSNGVKVGSGVSKVKVSFNSRYEVKTAGTKFVTLYKNSEQIVQASETGTLNERKQMTISPVLLEVTQGDVIKLQAYGTQGDILPEYRTYLTVEVVE